MMNDSAPSWSHPIGHGVCDSAHSSPRGIISAPGVSGCSPISVQNRRISAGTGAKDDGLAQAIHATHAAGVLWPGRAARVLLPVAWRGCAVGAACKQPGRNASVAGKYRGKRLAKQRLACQVFQAHGQRRSTCLNVDLSEKL